LAQRDSSELESFVLGLIWQMGPASAYDVRTHMRDSPSTQWSASAGAIYPLCTRLEKRGLIKGASKRAGKRARREYAITAKGLAALRKWVGPPLGESAVTVAHDPLRSRARFLGALSARERMEWVSAARAALDEVERRVKAWQKTSGQWTMDSGQPEKAEAGAAAAARLMTRSGELDVASRREWVGEVERAIG
jgi:DNA-binding PadR family transcriptional regulator